MPIFRQRLPPDARVNHWLNCATGFASKSARFRPPSEYSRLMSAIAIIVRTLQRPRYPVHDYGALFNRKNTIGMAAKRRKMHKTGDTNSQEPPGPRLGSHPPSVEISTCGNPADVELSLVLTNRYWRQHLLYFRPLPHGQGSFLPIFPRSAFALATRFCRSFAASTSNFYSNSAGISAL